MITPEHIILILALAFGFYMAWSIGANDVANAMGTSVGSGAITLKQAIIIASVLEFSGAFFVGTNVTETVRKGIIDPSIFVHNPILFMLGMLSALLAAAAWLQLASYFGWPVSTTHSIVGAIVGFGLITGGVHAVKWPKLFSITMSWVVSPILSAIIAFIVFNIIRYKVYFSSQPLKSTKKIAPYLIFCVFFVLTLAMVFKGLKNLHLNLTFPKACLVAVIVGIIAAIIGNFLIGRVKGVEEIEEIEEYEEKSARFLFNIYRATKRIENAIRLAPSFSMKKELTGILEKLKPIIGDIESREIMTTKTEYIMVEKIFGYLQILSASFVAFAHGANDVANSVGPLAGIITVLKSGTVINKTPVPMWVLALGGFGIVIGLATWGWRVIETIGKKITELTPSRGFSAEFSAAITIVFASKLGLPISTTHTLVGAVLGVGMARGFSALNIKVVRDIIISWAITIPTGAFLTIIIFEILKYLF